VNTPLAGRRVVTTRDEPGELDRQLRAAGAEVVHVALIEIVDAEGADAELASALAGLPNDGWLIATSRHGARRVAAHPIDSSWTLAAVGTATARVLADAAGRPVDVVPEVQTAAALLAELPAVGDGRPVVLAQADIAEPLLAEQLVARGFDVTAIVAYRTRPVAPTDDQRRAALAADAVAFASGSAARSWVAAFGTATPGHVIAIGPTTAAAATAAGLQVTAIAADHSIAGLVGEVVRQLSAGD
jgi:uroporphyrinogen-III synthase